MSLGKNVSKTNTYEKKSNLSTPFWGLTKNRLDQLDAEPEDYNVRLDYPNGHITLSSQQVKDLLSNKKVAGDGDYKVNSEDIIEYLKKLIASL